MRKVNRGRASVPEILYGDDARTAKEALTSHYRLPTQERVRRRPPLKANIWTSDVVQETLYAVFSAKCAYCEAPLGRTQSGDVVHHRPTGNAIGTTNEVDSTSVEHYGWFAYEWENLFLSCVECNRSKRNLFPVDGPRARFRSTWSEAEASERALLLNPCGSDPKRHLRFWIDGTVTGADEVGRTTVEVLSLNRPGLISARAQTFRQCWAVLDAGRRDEKLLGTFAQNMSDEAPFSGGARIAFFYLLSELSAEMHLSRLTFRDVVADVIRIATAANEEQWMRLQGLVASGDPLRGQSLGMREVYSDGPRLFRAPWKPRYSQLRHISIRNFKGVSRLELEIPQASSHELGAPCMMLLGENSTGKSTTLQAIALALMGRSMRDRMGVSAEDFLPREVSGWQLDDSVDPEVVLGFDTGEPVTLRIDPLTKRFLGDEEPAISVFAFGARRFFGKDGARRQQASTFKSLFDPFAKLQHPGGWLQGLDSDVFDALARALREVLVLQEGDSIDRDNEGRLFVRAHGRDTPLERLSDGYRSLIAMVLDVMRGMLMQWGDLENARGLVLIDEIETHLHPRWKLRVVSALRRSMPNVQFVATTHDPLCLRGMRDREVQVLVRNLDHKIEVLTGLPDVRGLRAEQLLTSDYFGLSSTADPEVEGALERLALTVNAPLNDGRDREALQAFRWLGDTPFEQIVNEALKRFVEREAGAPTINRAEVREAAVNDVLDRLASLRVDRQR